MVPEARYAFDTGDPQIQMSIGRVHSKMGSYPLYTVDAFSSTMFGGNQAAVCLVGSRKITDDVMQSLASEMNISATAFLQSDEKVEELFKCGSIFKIRWFSPTNEISLCGHATLASAAVIFYECGNINDEITFSSISGDLKARIGTDGITLDFPSNVPEKVDTEAWSHLLTATLGEFSDDVEELLIAQRRKYLLVVMNDKHSHDNLKSIKPDFREMLQVHDGSVIKGIIVTAEGNSGYEFISRFFAPWNGIPEDPVTGSAHTVLGPYWSRKFDKDDLHALQCSKRGGEVIVRVGSERVRLTGSAVIVLRGSVNLVSQSD